MVHAADADLAACRVRRKQFLGPSQVRIGMDFVTGLGLFSSFLTVSAYLPQVLKSWGSGETKDLSLKTFGTFCVASALWIIYGSLKTDVAIIGTNAILLCFQLSLVYLKLRQ